MTLRRVVEFGSSADDRRVRHLVAVEFLDAMLLKHLTGRKPVERDILLALATEIAEAGKHFTGRDVRVSSALLSPWA
jgi:hypothetical protein